MHSYDIKDKIGCSLDHSMYMFLRPVPKHWKNEDEMSIFDKAYFGIIPDITNHKPEE